MINEGTTIRLCEWSTADAIDLTLDQRRNIAEALTVWKEANDLPDLPLWFSGPEGKTLNSKQYVGVIELPDIVIEIYPKLDKRLIEEEKIRNKEIAGSVMSDLLWILDVSGHLGISEIDIAGLKETPSSFYDVFALLMAKHLLAELDLGVPHKYVSVSDDIRMVRGKIFMLDQITRNLNRSDMISCEWDEFSSDIPLNQLLKCSCSFLRSRVSNSGVAKVLIDCISQYDSICDVSPQAALTGVIGHRWDRTSERFRPAFDLAKRLLQGIGHSLSSADTSTFVFLLDMNKVFEEYVKAILEAYFNVGIETQKHVGWLFPELYRGKVQQRADYCWRSKDHISWVGDAKYKHLTKNKASSLTFTQIPEEENDSSKPAGKILNPSDIRQLTVYAELDRKKRNAEKPPNILLLYPFVGGGEAQIDTATAWNKSSFTLCPVKMNKQSKLEDALPSNMDISSAI